MTRFARFTTPLGPMYALATGDALLGVYFEGARHAPPIDAAWHEEAGDALLRACTAQVGEYFDGRRVTQRVGERRVLRGAKPAR